MREMSTQIEWLGNAAFRIKHEDKVFFVDPWLDGNPGCPLTAGQVKQADVIFVTHGHPGHWGRGDSVKIANLTGALYVAPRELCDYFLAKEMLPESQLFPVEPGKKYDVADVFWEVVSAPHPPVPRLPAWLAEVPGEPNCGFVWRFGHKVMFNIGDAKPDPLFEEIGNRYEIDLAIVPLWGKGMGIPMEEGINNCAEMVAPLNPAKVFPTNRYEEDNPVVKLLERTFRERGIKVEVIPQKIGIRIEV
jgi:L-ascorbate metabolism protein UlaG (beta-lactamase superfamily)